MEPEATHRTGPGRHTAPRGGREREFPAHRRPRRWPVLVSVGLLVTASAAGTVWMISTAVEQSRSDGQAPVFTDSASSPDAEPTDPGGDGPDDGDKDGKERDGQSEAGEFGSAVDLDVISVTVYRYEAAGKDDDGRELGSVEVKTCNTGEDTVRVGSGPWTLVFADDEVSEPVEARAAVASPAYPVEPRSLRPDKCVRGWLVFELPGGRAPAEIAYAPGGGDRSDAAAPAVTWQVR